MYKIIIRWSNKQLVKMINKLPDNQTSYSELLDYGVTDILRNEFTLEPMLLLKGVKPRPRPPQRTTLMSTNVKSKE
jgi:hypothetical protein